jgi:hypothetical protein
MDKRLLSERDICTKFITPALRQAGWDEMAQIREEVGFTKGRIIVRGKLVTRGKAKRADYILYFKPNIPLALIEAKDNSLDPRCLPVAGRSVVALVSAPLKRLSEPQQSVSMPRLRANRDEAFGLAAIGRL